MTDGTWCNLITELLCSLASLHNCTSLSRALSSVQKYNRKFRTSLCIFFFFTHLTATSSFVFLSSASFTIENPPLRTNEKTVSMRGRLQTRAQRKSQKAIASRTHQAVLLWNHKQMWYLFSSRESKSDSNESLFWQSEEPCSYESTSERRIKEWFLTTNCDTARFEQSSPDRTSGVGGRESGLERICISTGSLRINPWTFRRGRKGKSACFLQVADFRADQC